MQFVKSFTRPFLGALCCAAALLTADPADARRVALVIGNADYKVGPLRNPVADAGAVAEAFERKLGFDRVILKRNLDANAFRAALNELSLATSGADLGVIYFAGHGLEVNGKNFLIPIDATLSRAGALDLEAISLDTVLGQLEGVSRLKLVILDACRNNPFALPGAKRTVSRGLARIEPEDNTLVVYAAKDGTTADDGVGRRHSPFTGALLKHIATPNVEIRLLFGRVGDDVAAATNRAQQPHIYGTLGGREYYLKRETKTPAPQAVASAPSPVPAPSEVERAWALIKDSASIGVIEAFRRQYGAANALYDRLAAERIAELKAAEERKTAAAVPLPLPELTRLLKADLQRVGCAPGAIDGTWSDGAAAALERFARHAKMSLQTGTPTLAALDAVRGQRGRICPLECGPNAVERNGACVAKPAPGREPTKPKAAKAAPPPQPAQPPKADSSKPSLCWGTIQQGTSGVLVDCSHPSAMRPAF
jgi:hypothetical protein